MAPPIHEMRKAVMKAYPHSKVWAARVKKMPDDQIFRIYTRMVAENKL